MNVLRKWEKFLNFWHFFILSVKLHVRLCEKKLDGTHFDVPEKDRANSENFQNIYCFVTDFFLTWRINTRIARKIHFCGEIKCQRKHYCRFHRNMLNNTARVLLHVLFSLLHYLFRKIIFIQYLHCILLVL